ncbi:hypothetical protein [Listeria ilorinensis]|uniref:hypothetical protein n=1 Tax=Listeria ilorinensis TaxID=2867439 RepID=UPI001EF51F44|nr:hypothetical protein [Listeria ilorinensis]
MLLIMTLLISVVVYYVALVIITKIKFAQSNLKASFSLLLIVPIFIFKVHIKLAYEHRHEKRKVKLILRNGFVEYNVAVAILSEVMLFCAKQGIAENTSNRVNRQNVNELNKDEKRFNRVIASELAIA